MEFRRSGARDERRRRVLMEEVKESAGGEEPREVAGGPSGAAPAARYGEGARDERQPRITMLLPRRKLTLFVLVLLGACALAGIELLYGTVLTRAPIEQRELFRAFDLERPDSLAGWFTSALLLLAAQISLVIYSVRRYRVDDYRGRYRVWIAAAVVLALASLEAVAGLRHGVFDWLHGWAGQDVPGGVRVWQVAGGGTLGIAAFMRLLFEMRSSRGAVFVLILAAASYCGASGLAMTDVLASGPLDVMARHGLLLGGHLLLVLSLLTYGRCVYLEAQGLRPVRTKKPRARKAKATKAAKADSDKPARKTKSRTAAESAEPAEKEKAPTSTAASSKADESEKSNTRRAGGQQIRFDASHGSGASGQVTSKAKATLRVPAPAVADELEMDDDGRPQRKLSKAERKRLRQAKRDA